MAKILNWLPDKIIEYSFYLLFFLVPLILTPFNFELFEYNKMMATYGLTTIIVGAWLIKLALQGHPLRGKIFVRTPLDIPLLLFLTGQVISTIFSIDRHVSIWGYYSRFNGGLLSTISYILLYYAFVSNFPQEKIKKLLKVVLISGLLVSIYGILEHFGIDKDIWVQDVQNRVFSTLGQPNWLAAYLAVLIPSAIGLILNKFSIFNSQFSVNFHLLNFQIKNFKFNENFKFQISNYIGLLVYWIIGIIFYLTLLFTKSRSGFLGFWVSLIILWLGILVMSHFWTAVKKSDMTLKFLTITIFIFWIISFVIGTPFDQINKYTLPQLYNKQSSKRANEQTSKPIGDSIIDVGITESSKIREIVWKGAVDIFKKNPIFGTGVETFAFAYYKFRPAEHNMTSEWDFLYNKAHNEYLNYAANTGAFGLGSYLLVILVFVLSVISSLFSVFGFRLFSFSVYQTDKLTTGKHLSDNRQPKTDNRILPQEAQIIILALFTGWLSILITNFFGFSVVIIQLFFFLIPAIAFVLSDNQPATRNPQPATISNYQSAIAFLILLTTFYLLLTLGRLWYADVIFADGYQKSRTDDVAGSYQSLKKALEINDEEPFYYNEFSFPAAQVAVAFADEKQATLSAVLIKEATIASDFAISRSPQNVNYWKTRTRMFYTFSSLDEKYFNDSLYALEQAKILSPTDPKVRYNLALLYDRVGKKIEAIDEMIETTKLKPDFRDAFFALAYLYEKDKNREKAKESLQYILTKIATDDAEARKKLEELK